MPVFLAWVGIHTNAKGCCLLGNLEMSYLLGISSKRVENLIRRAKKRGHLAVCYVKQYGRLMRQLFLNTILSPILKMREGTLKMREGTLKKSAETSGQWGGDNLSTMGIFSYSNGHFPPRTRCTEQYSFTDNNKNKENTVIQNNTPGVSASINRSSEFEQPSCTVQNDCAVSVMSSFPFLGSVTEVVSRLSAIGTHEAQAVKIITSYGFKLVWSVINYVEDLKKNGYPIKNVGGYVRGCLTKIANGTFSLKQTKKCHNSELANTTNQHHNQAESLMGEGELNEKLAQTHLGNIRKWFSKNYSTIESYINNRLVDHKHIIFELSEILHGNVLARKNETVNELLNSESITIGRLHELCDQLMGEEKSRQESTKTIVKPSVSKSRSGTKLKEENESKQTEKTIHTAMSINERLAKIGVDLSDTVVVKTSLKIQEEKAKTAAEKEAHADRQRQYADAILENKSLATGGVQPKVEQSEAVISGAVKSQLKQELELKENFKNKPVQNKSEATIDAVNIQSQISAVRSENKIQIPPRQQDILDYIKTNKTVDQKSIKNKFENVDVRTIRRDLHVLIEQGLVTDEGSTRNKIYRPN